MTNLNPNDARSLPLSVDQIETLAVNVFAGFNPTLLVDFDTDGAKVDFFLRCYHPIHSAWVVRDILLDTVTRHTDSHRARSRFKSTANTRAHAIRQTLRALQAAKTELKQSEGRGV